MIPDVPVLTWLPAAAGDETVRPNGRPPANLTELVAGGVRCVCADMWAYRTMYEPSAVLRSMGLRGMKYFVATSVSAGVLQAARGTSPGRTAHLHRHAMITCHLDALVDQCADMEWALAFGKAVFGMSPEPPEFRPEHTAEFRYAIRNDYPLLRLVLEGPYKDVIVASLMQAAAVEIEKTRFRNAFEYKVASNMACVRPFLVDHLPGDAFEALAVCFTFLDDAFDVLEDQEQGHEPYMRTAGDVAGIAAVTRAAFSKLNESFVVDFSWLADVVVEVCSRVAVAQLSTPEEYKIVEAGALAPCVRLALTILAAYITFRSGDRR